MKLCSVYAILLGSRRGIFLVLFWLVFLCFREKLENTTVCPLLK